LSSSGIDEIEEAMLSHYEDRAVDQLLRRLSEFEIASKELQSAELNLAQARFIFDRLLQYPENGILSSKLSLDSNLTKDKNFELGVIKILEQRTLTTQELKDVRHLKTNTVIEDGNVLEKIQDTIDRAGGINVIGSFLDLYENQRKRRKIDDYLHPAFILPTSNICERLFSHAGYCYNDLRKSLASENLESQLFLFANRHLWDISILKEVMTSDL
jgi:hypothetical protein